MKHKIRKTKNYIFEITFTILTIFYAIFRLFTSSKAYSISMELVVSTVFIFGLLVKLGLGYLFPEITLNINGIKILGWENIKWKEIKSFTLNQNGEVITLKILKFNNKTVTENFKNLNIKIEVFDHLLNIYLNKFGSIYR